MRHFRYLFPALVSLALPAQPATSADAADLARKFKQLPTVPESELPELSNKLAPFRGIISHKGLAGHTWVAFPFVENAASLDVGPKGRVFVTEANRFWLGVPDLRGANEMVRDDFKAVTVADRLAMYEKFASHFPEGWFTKVADRVIRLEDRDGNGAPDHRTLFSDQFHRAEDGIGFSVLAERDAVYFTCIPSLWKMTDKDDDGKADTHESIADGFGVRVSFIGHDLHGIVRGPDGMLYFSVGDRGYHITTADGKVHPGSGRGAVFRCESDGSGLEVYAMGLRNPQELAFDDYGNLFTFDNTGDIGDRARMVYVLENSDSGWDMSHQSPHHYAKVLDWGEFRPPKAVWVEEKMFDTWNETQPQWVYPPAAHVASGPSGVTWLTGDAVPADLRDHFLLTDYRGASQQSATFAVGLEPKGAGYGAKGVREIVKGVAASDVELGYDGRIFLADFGGGWSINTNASIQVLEPIDEAAKKSGAEVAKLIAEGFDGKPAAELVALLGHADQRVRFGAQFELAKKGEKAQLESLAKNSAAPLLPRLHAIWALGQLGRKGTDVSVASLEILSDSEPEIRANTARLLGDLRAPSAREKLIALLGDDSPRVRSLAAIALGRVCKNGDPDAIAALYKANLESPDVVLRHSILSALDRVGTVDFAAAKATSPSREERLLAVLFLRRHASPELVAFLSDADPLVRREAIRAIYDTKALDTQAGNLLAGLSPAGLPEALQRRIIAANYRLGKPANAQRILALASDASLPDAIRSYALHGLAMWTAAIETDPVLGHYRPQVVTERPKEKLAPAITAGLRRFLAGKHDPELVTLATKLANDTGIALDESTLRTQVADAALDAEVRVATLDSLAKLGKPEDDAIIANLLKDKSSAVQAAAIRHAFERGIDGIEGVALDAIQNGALEAARAAIAGTDPTKIKPFWESKETKLRKELWLDVYQKLAATDADVQAWAAEKVGNPQSLAEFGGDVRKGEQVFRNQGGCMQCHLVNGAGGIQGPDLTLLAERLPSAKILESLINPNAEISEGYGMSTATLKDDSVLIGRLAKETPEEVLLIGLDGAETRLKRSEIKSLTPPVSAMPPMAMVLPLPELRDLVAYLGSRTKETAAAEDAASHGEEGEDVAK